jgi:hypothetical protein
MTPIDEPPVHPARFRIWAAREVAHARACRCRSHDAGDIANIACGIAARWCFDRRASQSQLESVIRIVRWMHLASAQLERLEAVGG